MPKKHRALALADIAALLQQAAEGGSAEQFYGEVEQIAGETIGWRLFTILRYVEAAGAVERLYSSDRKAYPVGGRKPLDKIATSRGVLEQGECFLAANKQEVRQAFFDHE